MKNIVAYSKRVLSRSSVIESVMIISCVQCMWFNAIKYQTVIAKQNKKYVKCIKRFETEQRTKRALTIVSIELKMQKNAYADTQIVLFKLSNMYRVAEMSMVVIAFVFFLSFPNTKNINIAIMSHQELIDYRRQLTDYNPYSHSDLHSSVK